MTQWTTREELVQRVVSLVREKVSRRAIAISLGVSRNTVRRILEKHAVQRQTEHSALPQPKARAPRASKLDPHKARISELLGKYANITAQRVFEILRVFRKHSISVPVTFDRPFRRHSISVPGHSIADSGSIRLL